MHSNSLQGNHTRLQTPAPFGFYNGISQSAKIPYAAKAGPDSDADERLRVLPDFRLLYRLKRGTPAPIRDRWPYVQSSSSFLPEPAV
jgi:hypothetical protein